ncbi:ribosome maturation factor RimM [Marinicella gelatinilytica]|uniref:ribosome maturation factor RimM n=1 Tax=Marinicella gelatinilytica TaxID=2996017 RepID=UPI0022608199|nr:ribosome maturation factor RimM [Marinicella gelatinilytica]MCX7544297.1 ribosome maturation factor RimM [Marinicella gelatinilytica]
MSDDLLTVGKITGHFGVQGGLKVFSYTQPMDNITAYQQWYIGERLYKGIKAKKHGKTIIAQLPDINSREAAEALIGQTVSVNVSQLSALPEDDFYWHQLIGLTVINQDDQTLGCIDSLFETGANDVMVVKSDQGDMLIPYLYGQTVERVDLVASEIRVNWTEIDQPEG